MESTNVPYHFIYRIIFVGDASVGKTAIANALISDRVPVLYSPTIGIDFFSTINVLNDETIIKSQIWDTAGQDRYKSLTRIYYQSADIVLLCYDISNLKSFESLQFWIKDVKSYCNNPLIKIFLIGNKIDIKHKEILETHLNKYQNFKSYQISTKTNQNFNTFQNDLFNSCLKIIKFKKPYLPIIINKKENKTTIHKKKTIHRNHFCFLF